jgi:predicted methyltransferase
MNRLRLTLPLVLALACGGASDTAPDSEESTGGADTATGSVEAAIAGSHRSEENRARDEHRHPAETLAFFGLEPTMTVVEMAPGGGWYTEILAPTLKDQGKLIAAIPDPEESEYGERFMTFLQSEPELYSAVEPVIFMPPERTSLGPDGSADMVVTFRSTHGWINRDQAADVYAAMFRVLKPGGILGVVQHRADEGADPAVTAEDGYVPEAYVIGLAEAAGFVLEEKSELNANPADDHDHPEGVWTLPPSLRLGADQSAEYEAIGESDRMTLRFRKPAA